MPTPLDKILLTVLAVAAMFAAVMLAGFIPTAPRPGPVAPVVAPVGPVEPTPKPSPSPKPQPTPAPLPVAPVVAPDDARQAEFRAAIKEWLAHYAEYERTGKWPGPKPDPSPSPTPIPPPIVAPTAYDGPLIGMLVLPANESPTLAALRPPNASIEAAFAAASATYRVANVDTLTAEMPGWSPIVDANGPAPVVVWATPGKDGKVLGATRLDASASAAVNGDAIVAGLKKVRGK